jgi:osmotically-inducible protein OsmY
MIVRHTLAAAVMAVATLAVVLPGCAVSRGQSTVGEYIDDATLTTKVKAKFAEDKSVDATAINVETLNGEVMLSGFAKSSDEKMVAEKLARSTRGVKSVKNSIDVRM